MILFMVSFRPPRALGRADRCIVSAGGREDAKRQARHLLGAGNPDEYVVQPLSKEGDRVVLSFSMQLLQLPPSRF